MRLFGGWLVLGILVSAHVAWAAEKRVEVPILNALIPGTGYDDNDSIEAVVTGELPSPCFTLGETTVERARHGFRLKQYAWMRSDGQCGSGDLIEDPVPFVSEVKLGKLSQGRYELLFNPSSRTPRESERKKEFSVEPAPVDKIDTFDYAAVTNAGVSDYFTSDQSVHFTFSGSFSSRCMRLKQSLQADRVGDVFIVLPILEEISGISCRGPRKPFQQTVELGTLPPGEYLIHLRSRNGKAINRVFSVVNSS